MGVSGIFHYLPPFSSDVERCNPIQEKVGDPLVPFMRTFLNSICSACYVLAAIIRGIMVRALVGEEPHLQMSYFVAVYWFGGHWFRCHCFSEVPLGYGVYLLLFTHFIIILINVI